MTRTNNMTPPSSTIITADNMNSGTQEFMATLAGVAVEEYDKLLGSYQQDLVKINDQKTELRKDRDTISKMQNRGVLSNQALKEGEPPVEGRTIDSKDFGSADKPGDAAFYLNKYGVEQTAYSKTSDGKYFIPDSVWENMKEKIDDKIQNSNSTSEIKMIYFQALMDSRKQAMLMLSNMITSENSTKMAIIQNLKG